MLRLAHISDLHFPFVNWDPRQLLSKRWLGNLNYVLKRRHSFDHSNRLPALLDFFKEQAVTHVAISGDFSITSHPEEFKRATTFVHELQHAGFTTVAIPGNHDHYTGHAHRQKLFYRYFPEHLDEKAAWNLKDHQVSLVQIRPHLWVVALDTALATSLLSSHGLFSEKIEANLAGLLAQIPAGDQIILINHFPFFKIGPPKNRLERGEALRKIIEKHPNILLYLHGHTHQQIIADLRPNGLPIISDPGSTAEIQHGACHLIQIDQDKVLIDVCRFDQKWKCTSRHRFAR